jgi:hypothetical protein
MAIPIWLTGIFSGGMSIVKEWVGSWAERKKMEAQHKVKMAELQMQGKETRALMDKQHEVEWDTAMAKATESSWKDEWFTIILSIPLVGCFIPKVAPYILEGFEVLAVCPDWYKAAVGVAIAASFGVRKYADWTMKQYTTGKDNGAGETGPQPEHRSFKLSRKSLVDAIKDEAKKIKEDITGED